MKWKVKKTATIESKKDDAPKQTLRDTLVIVSIPGSIVELSGSKQKPSCCTCQCHSRHTLHRQTRRPICRWFQYKSQLAGATVYADPSVVYRGNPPCTLQFKPVSNAYHNSKLQEVITANLTSTEDFRNPKLLYQVSSMRAFGKYCN